MGTVHSVRSGFEIIAQKILLDDGVLRRRHDGDIVDLYVVSPCPGVWRGRLLCFLDVSGFGRAFLIARWTWRCHRPYRPVEASL